ncbi:hypothetical protein NPIL_468071 [Nephila pilipes]|uniref:Uncharacterized protein n=1 Tax=Nephila pilipes TaxID=299642 RepID=A0A8X6NZ13_NEPPI|nr:hypothetical protein NPIL_468071 [Nephila pilipes]
MPAVACCQRHQHPADRRTPFAACRTPRTSDQRSDERQRLSSSVNHRNASLKRLLVIYACYCRATMSTRYVCAVIPTPFTNATTSTASRCRARPSHLSTASKPYGAVENTPGSAC